MLTLTVKQAENKRTYELWLEHLLICQDANLEKLMKIAMMNVENHGYELVLNV